ncbi:MAG: GGDEF domain-containing protein [Elusimicrobia bacterium]|nr:GGDEF domain-containing protein [Elusimicrobiota bacterium]
MNKLLSNVYLQFALALANFFILYSLLTLDIARLLLAFALFAFGMHFALKAKRLFAACMAIAAISIVVTFYPYNLVFCAIFLLLLFLVFPIPYYYAHKWQKEESAFSARNRKLKDIYDGLISEHNIYDKEKKRLEDSIERIMQLYLVARDFLTSTQIEDSFNTLMTLLSKRHGVKSISIFSRNASQWQPVAFSDILKKDAWASYLSGAKTLEHEISAVIAERPVWIDETSSIVYWPLRNENMLLACVILEVDEADGLDYVEEGSLFAPHVALGVKRINLFTEVRKRSRNDGLTGLYLRRYFMERFQSEIQREKRYSGGFCIFMMDIDFFKKINDTYGHLTGDKVLCAVAKTIFNCVRPGDLVGRYGGEEFIALLPMIDPEQAYEIAQTIRSLVRQKGFEQNDNKFSISISIGISRYPEDGTTVEELTSAADKALYHAKQNGRNMVVSYKDI